MATLVSRFIQTLVSEEIRRIVAGAVGARTTLSSSIAARQVIRAYPHCGLSEREVADEIIMAAAKSGVAVEMGDRKAA